MFTALVQEVHARTKKRYGSPRICMDLRRQGFAIAKKRVLRLMRSAGLRGQMKRAFRCTTNSGHGLPVALNILDRNFEPSAPNQVWAGDTTELRTANGGKLYLAVVLDLYSRFVVGWSLSATNDTRLVLGAIEMALKRRSPPAGLLHHSDQGSPYASERYQELLRAHGIVSSMSRRGNCYDNAVVESFFSTLKAELGRVFETAGVAKAELFDYIEVFYNQQRLHSSVGYRSPAEHERDGVMLHQVAA